MDYERVLCLDGGWQCYRDGESPPPECRCPGDGDPLVRAEDELTHGQQPGRGQVPQRHPGHLAGEV